MTEQEIAEVRQIVAEYLNANGGVVEELSTASAEDIANGVVASLPAFKTDTQTYVLLPLSLLQPKLVSGSNISTINGTSLLGGGDITISGGGDITVDTAMNESSTNPVQNMVITSALNDKMDEITEEEFNSIFT